MHSALRQLEHRPWPLPTGPWTWRQSWKDLLFAHWPLSVSELRGLVPDGLNLQEFDGTSWIGVVPFRMSGVMRRPLPDLPWVSAFPELNVRLYVEHNGIPGVWFLSLDASNALAVWAARRFFHLPYHHARIDFKTGDEHFHFSSQRTVTNAKTEFEATYQPAGEAYFARPGSLEAFLIERYCLYARSPNGELYRGDVHHAPWPLQQASGKVKADPLLETHGLSTKSQAPLLHFSRGVDVAVWSLKRLSI